MPRLVNSFTAPESDQKLAFGGLAVLYLRRAPLDTLETADFGHRAELLRRFAFGSAGVVPIR